MKLARQGRKSAAQTPAPKSERIRGSVKNPAGTASSKKSGSNIKFSSQVINSLTKKRDEYNEKHSGKVDLPTLKAVYRRGAGAYSSSHRPTITGGVPNSRNAWAMARVNKFLLKKSGKPVKKAYVQDDDLMAEGGETAELLAPNGKPSNLTPEQYRLVRTPEFKAWFGDWENDPENASKVVDENGEPMVVYHGTNNDFTIFKLEKPTIAAYGQGYYFTNDKQFASNYARGQNAKILSLFLKIKNFFEIYEDELPSGYEKYSEMENNKGLSRDFTNKLVFNGYDGVYAKNRFNENELVVFNSNQIKLADGSNNTFDPENPDIRYAKGGFTNQIIRCKGCGWQWDTKDSDESDKYVCHQCGFDNRTFYNAEPIGRYAQGGETSGVTADNYFVSTKAYFEGVDPKDAKKILEAYKYYRRRKNKPEFIKSSKYGNLRVDYESEKKNAYFERRSLSYYFVTEDNSSVIRISDHWSNSQYDDSEKLNCGNIRSCFWTTDGNRFRYDIPNQKHTSILIAGICSFNEFEMIPKITFDKGGQAGKLLAPNGKPSNLTLEQYRLVRTPEFKAWFGDWENDPQNASKVVDENGEPLICNHSSLEKDIDIFDGGRIFRTQSNRVKPIWFTYSKGSVYADGEDIFQYKCYLNIRNIFDYSNQKNVKDLSNYFLKMTGKKLPEYDFDWDWDAQEMNNLPAYIFEMGFDGYKFSDENSVVVFNSKQIKLADGRNTTFDRNNPDIRFAKGGEMDDCGCGKAEDGMEVSTKKELPVGKLAKGMTLEQIARLHRYSPTLLRKNLKEGIKTEMEHTDDKEIAEAIALDHLYEDPEYYRKLKLVETLPYGTKSWQEASMAMAGKPDHESIEISHYIFDQREKAYQVIYSDDPKISRFMICLKLYDAAKMHENSTENPLEKNMWLEISHIWKMAMNDVKNDVKPTQNIQEIMSLSNIFVYANGGLAYGNSHKNGGIKLLNKSTNTYIEIEGGEGVVKADSMQLKEKMEFEGEKLTACEIVSKINERTGGVKFKCSDVKRIIDNDGKFA